MTPRQPNPTTLTEQVLALAARPGGMSSADVSGFSLQQAGQCCSRLMREGRVFVARTDRRTARYYGTEAEALKATGPARPVIAGDFLDAKGRPADVSRAKFTARATPAGATWAAPARHRMPDELPFVPRAGSMEFEQHPSRSGNELRYRSGHVTRIEA